MDTWEWTENPYLVGLHWAHGFWQRDRSVVDAKYQRVMGSAAAGRATKVTELIIRSRAR